MIRMASEMERCVLSRIYQHKQDYQKIKNLQELKCENGLKRAMPMVDSVLTTCGDSLTTLVGVSLKALLAAAHGVVVDHLALG